MESSESDEDDYYPEDIQIRSFRRITKNKTCLPTNETARNRRHVRDSRLAALPRSNSEACSVAVQDIWSENPCKLRKNSCDCKACGGEKLAKRIQFTAIPMQEIQRKANRMSSIGALEILIRNCRSGSLLAPLIGNYRLSAIIKSLPNKVFVSPPSTPHLSKFLSSSTPRPVVKKKRGRLQFRAIATAMTFTSPLHCCKQEDSVSDLRLRGVLRATPSTTNSERKGGNAGRSMGISLSGGELPRSKFSTHIRPFL